MDIDSVDQNTPLHYFCQKFRSPSCVDLGEQMIKQGANINKRKENGEVTETN